MPTFEAQVKAAELQRQLATLTGHELAKVRPCGKHLLIQMHRGDAVDTIARLTAIGRNAYSSAFRSHTGRWEPLPGRADLRTTADLVVTPLAPYFDANSYRYLRDQRSPVLSMPAGCKASADAGFKAIHSSTPAPVQGRTAAIGRSVIFPLTCIGAGEGCLEVAQRCTRPAHKMSDGNFDATQDE
jgi:hypothetical protein